MSQCKKKAQSRLHISSCSFHLSSLSWERTSQRWRAGREEGGGVNQHVRQQQREKREGTCARGTGEDWGRENPEGNLLCLIHVVASSYLWLQFISLEVKLLLSLGNPKQEASRRKRMEHYNGMSGERAKWRRSVWKLPCWVITCCQQYHLCCLGIPHWGGYTACEEKKSVGIWILQRSSLWGCLPWPRRSTLAL